MCSSGIWSLAWLYRDNTTLQSFGVTPLQTHDLLQWNVRLLSEAVSSNWLDRLEMILLRRNEGYTSPMYYHCSIWFMPGLLLCSTLTYNICIHIGISFFSVFICFPLFHVSYNLYRQGKEVQSKTNRAESHLLLFFFFRFKAKSCLKCWHLFVVCVWYSEAICTHWYEWEALSWEKEPSARSAWLCIFLFL